MPIYFQQQVNNDTRLGIWKIEETEEFFKSNVPQHRDVTHPHKRLQHLAGRFLLQFLQPGFPYQLIQIADTRKPFLPNEEFHFSISHCGDYAAAIVSKTKRVGIDIEIPVEKIETIKNKFLSETEQQLFLKSNVKIETLNDDELRTTNYQLLTTLWSCKEAVFKWYGDGGVDFKKDILLQQHNVVENIFDCLFAKNNTQLKIQYHQFDHLVLAYVV